MMESGWTRTCSGSGMVEHRSLLLVDSRTHRVWVLLDGVSGAGDCLPELLNNYYRTLYPDLTRIGEEVESLGLDNPRAIQHVIMRVIQWLEGGGLEPGRGIPWIHAMAKLLVREVEQMLGPTITEIHSRLVTIQSDLAKLIKQDARTGTQSEARPVLPVDTFPDRGRLRTHSGYQPGDPSPDLLTEEEAIRYLRLDQIDIKNPEETLRRYRKEGHLRGTQISKRVFYLRSELDDLLKKLTEINPR